MSMVTNRSFMSLKDLLSTNFPKGLFSFLCTRQASYIFSIIISVLHRKKKYRLPCTFFPRHEYQVKESIPFLYSHIHPSKDKIIIFLNNFYSGRIPCVSQSKEHTKCCLPQEQCLLLIKSCQNYR